MKRTLIVLLILAGLGGYVYFVEVKGGEKKEKAEKDAKRLVPFVKPDIDLVTIENDGKVMTVQKIDGAWRMTAPVSDAADEDIVESVLTTLTGAESKGTVDQISDERAFGFLAPKVKYVVGFKDKRVELVVGKKSPVSGDSYILVDGKPPVHLTAANLDTTGNRKPDDLRNKEVFAFKADDVAAVTVKDGASTLVVRRAGAGWQVLSPSKLEADQALADGLAADVANLRVSGWIAEAATPADLAKHGLAKPTVVIEAELKSGAKHRIYTGLVDGNDRAARIDDRAPIYKVADWSIRNMMKTPADLKDRRLFAVPATAIARLEFASERGTVGLRRQGAGWSVESNSSSEGNAEKINELVTALTDYRANEWQSAVKPSLKAKGLAPARRTVTAWDAGGNKLAALKLGNEEDGWAVWAQTDDESLVAKASSDFVKNQWPDAPEALFAAPPTAAAAGAK